MVRAQLLRCFSGNTHTRRIHQTLIHNVICKTWAMWSGPPAAPMMSLLCGVNKLTRRNKSQRAHAHTTSTAVMEELWGVPAPTQYKKTLTHTHTHSLLAVTTLAVRARAMCGHAVVLSAPWETCHPCIVSENVLATKSYPITRKWLLKCFF